MTAEEKQRVLGIILDFYASYVPNAAPLDFKQKFNPAWKATSDPFAFVLAAAIAGIQQSQNYFKGYGQGFKGYAKRSGANYTNTVTADFIGDAILPSLLKQDPRCFYKGAGTTRSRILYALPVQSSAKATMDTGNEITPESSGTSQRRGFRTFTILPVIAMVRR